jgi:hypothetical protein
MSSLCPDFAEDVSQHVNSVWADGVILRATGSRQSVRATEIENGDSDAPSDWRPFIYDGRTYYFIPLDGA